MNILFIVIWFGCGIITAGLLIILEYQEGKDYTLSSLFSTIVFILFGGISFIIAIGAICFTCLSQGKSIIIFKNKRKGVKK